MKFGTDGVRGVAHTELTTSFARRLARAAARVLTHVPDASPPIGGDEVVVGGDTRESTADFVQALASGFSVEGLRVVDLGVVPTPVVAFEAQRRGSIGAVVSASHNAYTDNGIKLFARGGTKLTDDVQHQIEILLEGPLAPGSDVDVVPGHAATVEAPDHAAYVEHVLGILEGDRLDGLHVVVDCANGAAFEIAPEVLRSAGARVTVLADRPDGRNINDGCGATAPGRVAAAVVAEQADAGVALDGDADRLIAVDGTGRVVDGDHIIAICALDLFGRGRLRNDTVVVTVMSNLGLRLAMREAGIRVLETAVGDRYVLEALASGGHSLGGEQSGHVVFADHATTGDGVLTAVALLDAVQRSGRSLAGAASAAMTSLPQVLLNVRVADRVPDIAERIADQIETVEAALGSRGRVLIRASGTEPLIRVMVEAPTREQARDAADDLVAAVREQVG